MILPAVGVTILVRQRNAEILAQQRLDHELEVARGIQLTLIPKEMPSISGWELAAYYRPAKAVGGDFYDFIQFDDGRLGLIIGCNRQRNTRCPRHGDYP
jgi:serine phosphatase RsbU (regulator of sigma subunit)